MQHVCGSYLLLYFLNSEFSCPFKSYIILVIYNIIISICSVSFPCITCLHKKAKKILFKSKNPIEIKNLNKIKKVMIFPTLKMCNLSHLIGSYPIIPMRSCGFPTGNCRHCPVQLVVLFENRNSYHTHWVMSCLMILQPKSREVLFFYF